MPSKTHNLKRANNYAAVHKIFERTKPRKGRDWEPTERPLGDSRQRHYRVVRGPDAAFYDVVLYRTTLARFYRPEADGSTRHCYNGASRTTSKMFMSDVLHVSVENGCSTTDGTVRFAPIANARGYDGHFTTDLVFDAHHRLDIARSSHAPLVSLHPNPNRALWKKELRAKWAVAFDLLEMTVQDTIEAARKAGYRAYGASDNGLTWESHRQLAVGINDEELTPATVNALRELYTVLAERLVATRNASANPGTYNHALMRMEFPSNPYKLPAPRSVTTEALNYMLKRFAPINGVRDDVARPLPMFPEMLPSKWKFA